MSGSFGDRQGAEPLTQFRYQAFISYSHADEQWASWLQHALEGYRVPTRLARENSQGELPQRIAPVFRDREDFSSASSLSDSIIDALNESAALIVVCSTAAAASSWVNEEIRQFRALGRGDRIFCMLVDDMDAGPGRIESVFPPALFEGEPDGGHEPLAADPRDSGDGKRLALLKMVAALLGVRLDQLRQRDLTRKRRWQIGAAGVAIIAALLVVTAITSRLSEQHERAKAEQMATFIVDLGEDLQADVDLETLRRISARAMGYLENLDQRKLSIETNMRVGQALRQLGQVSLQQGRNEEALSALQRSLDLYVDLQAQHPDNLDVLFERSQAEFYVGNCYFELGDYSAAKPFVHRYVEVADALYDAEPDNRQWLLERSYAAMNLVVLGTSAPEPVTEAFLTEVEETVALAEESLAAWPGSSDVILHVANTKAWAADAHLRACDLGAAATYREANFRQAQAAAQDEPSNRIYQRALAYAHSGVAALLKDSGRVEESEQHYRASIDILASLLARDESSQFLAKDIAANQVLLANLLGALGRYDEAFSFLEEARAQLQPAVPLAELSITNLEDYSTLLLVDALIAIESGQTKKATDALAALKEIIDMRSTTAEPVKKDADRAGQYQYLRWRLSSANGIGEPGLLPPTGSGTGKGLRSCYDAELGAKSALVRGDDEAIREEVLYLREHGYKDPNFVRFCERYTACELP